MKSLVALTIFQRTNYNIVRLVYGGKMEILLGVIILVFVLGSVGLFFSNQFDARDPLPRSTKAKKSGTRSDEPGVKKPRLVKINPGSISCLVAREMTDKIYLAKEAPVIPLDQCVQEKCFCKYLYFDDRRSDKHRRATHEYLGGFIKNHPTDRRQYSGRRTTDILV
jgi:hypothetical protein